MFRFVFCAVVLSGFAAAPKEKENCPDGKQHYRTTIRHIESGGIGYEDGYTTFEAFLASDPSQWRVTPFLDARGHVFDNGKWAANVGAGLRALWGNRIYGINTYYDYRNTSHFHSNQMGAGLETLGELFDFRINGYLPFGTKTGAPYDAIFEAFSGHYMIVSPKYKSAMKGADAEFGFHFGKSKNLDFYAAAGPYYFVGEKAPVTWGGKARIAGTFKDILTLEVSDSYDRTFHNKFQGQISLSFSFGPKSKVKEEGRSCKAANTLNNRMLQPVDRQEIIVIDTPRKNTVAIDPATGLPYFFVFVDNTSSSNGTYESPYHSFAQAQSNSSRNDIIYVFPGNGTTTGMNAGITLKASQQLLGSGVSHSLQTSAGTVSIPPQTATSPTITNTDVDTELNAVTLASNNTVSGFTIASAMNDAILGADAQDLEVSFCTFQNTTTYAIEASFSSDASISIRNNRFVDNVNGISLNLDGTSDVYCANNTFEGQTSVSSVPLEIGADSNAFTALIENNIFNDNTAGSIRFNFTNVVNADITALNNTITNNGTGSQSSLGSSLVILSNGTIDNCSVALTGNTFSGNTSNALYLHTSGEITTLEVTASTNTMSDNGGSALVLATPVETLTLIATDNTFTGLNDNGIAAISAGSTSTGNITISDNTITDIGNSSNGIAINQNFTTLHLTILDNEIDGCEGTGIISYAPMGIGSLTLTVSGNTISNCENMSSNAASGLNIEQYTSLAGTITDNTLSNNTGTSFVVASALPTPTVCLTLSGNSSGDYTLTNPGDGVFNLSPCNVDSVNTGTISTTGDIDYVQSCPGAAPCPP